MSPHKWRHFLFTWLKKEGIDDALIQPYSGHATRQLLEVSARLSLPMLNLLTTKRWNSVGENCQKDHKIATADAYLRPNSKLTHNLASKSCT